MKNPLTRISTLHLRLIGTVVVFGLTTSVLFLTRASGSVASLEAETATLAGGTHVVAATTASGGHAVQFGSTVTPSPTPAPSSTPTPPASPSGQAMPVGDLPGWHQVFTDDFTTGNVPVGSFPGSYQNKWDANYYDGTKDTAGQQGSPSRYYPSKVLSIKDGVMDMYLHSENGTPMGAAPMPKINGATSWPYDSLKYGRVSVRFKSDALKGFKTAWLMWPDSGRWPNDGEIDFPEGDLNGTIGAFNHRASSANQADGFGSNAYYTTWHTATMEWSPGKVEFFLDGVSIGATTVGIPSNPMHYMLQTESCLSGCPAASTAGHLQLDWIAMWSKL